MTDHKNALRSGTVLDNRYRLEAVLGAGGFGIVYRASQTHLGTQHAIKEYLPQEIALREGTTVLALSSKSREDYEEGLARFLSEARQLVPFAGHPNIVNCTDFFEANGTAYLVMQYEDGLALDELAAAREQNGEPFEEDEIVGLMYPLLRGLQVVHEANVLHRDIKLGNIFIRRADEQPVLLDFGAAKQEFSKHSKSRGAPYTPGYAAPEQVEEEGQLGPWTDIHAVGAVFYRLMAGEVPIKSESRTMRLLRGQADPVQQGLDKLEGEGRFSTSLIKAVRACLAVEVKDRVPSVMELLLNLDSRGQGSTGREQLAKPEPHIPETPPKKPEVRSAPPEPHSKPAETGSMQASADGGSRGRKMAAGAVVAVFILGLVSTVLVTKRDKLEDNKTGQEQTTAKPASEKDRMKVFVPGGLLPQVALIESEMIDIPAGQFRMGDISGDGYKTERPVHIVTVKPFKISKHEITFEQWDACVTAGGCEHIPDDEGWGRGRNPVIGVSHRDIVNEFIPWLNDVTGGNYRLPSEAEWEYAARAGTITKYSWGDDIDCSKAHFGRDWEERYCAHKNVEAGTSKTGHYPENPFGLHDMHGNASEWVQDCWNDTYQGAPGDGQAWIHGDCSHRVLRGGGWYSKPSNIVSAARHHFPAGIRLNVTGFRLAHD